jgi:hypothetical protein
MRQLLVVIPRILRNNQNHERTVSRSDVSTRPTDGRVLLPSARRESEECPNAEC